MLQAANKSVTIRPFQKEDRARVREICYETSFLEDPKSYTHDCDVVADVLTAYSTDVEPESSLVAVADGRVVGYLVGVKNLKRMNQVFFFRMLWGVLGRAFVRGTFFRLETWRFLWSTLVCWCKGQLNIPDFSRDYPASLHINIDRAFRGQKIGERLIAEYVNFLRREKISGVLASVMTEAGEHFFIKNGFQVLYKTRRELFRYRLGRDVPQYLLGRKIQ